MSACLYCTDQSCGTCLERRVSALEQRMDTVPLRAGGGVGVASRADTVTLDPAFVSCLSKAEGWMGTVLTTNGVFMGSKVGYDIRAELIGWLVLLGARQP